MSAFQPLVRWMATPEGLRFSRISKALRRKPACGSVYAFQWFARRAVNRNSASRPPCMAQMRTFFLASHVRKSA